MMKILTLIFLILVLTIGAGVPVFARSQMSYDQALQQITINNRHMQSLRATHENLQRQLRDINATRTQHALNVVINENYHETFPFGWFHGSFAAWQVEIINAAEQTETNLRRLEINKQILTTAIELEFRNALAQIELAALEITMLKAAQDLNEQSLNAVRLMHSLNLETAATLLAAETSVQQTAAAIESAKITYSTNRRELNRLLSLAPEATVTITHQPRRTPHPPVLHSHIWVQYYDSPVVKLARLDYRDAFIMYYTYRFLLHPDERTPSFYRDWFGNYDFSLIHLRNDRAASRRAIEAEQVRIANHIRTLHSNLAQLNIQRTATQAALTAALENYRAANVRYTLGMITPLQLQAAELEVLQHEITLAQIEIGYDLALFMYVHPYV